MNIQQVNMKLISGLQRRIFWIYFRRTVYALIIGAIGSIIGAYFQKQNWYEQNELTKLENDRKRAEEIFSEVSTLMDDRLYKTVRLLSAYKQNNNQTIIKYKESFIAQLEEWNSNKGRINALLDGYFGESFSQYFLHQIQNDFAICGNMLSYDPQNNIIQIDSITKGLRPKIFILNKRMIQAIKCDQVGRYADK